MPPATPPDPKTPRSRRVIPVPPSVIEAIRGHRVHQLEHRLAIGAAWRDLGLVFTNEIGEPLDRQTIHRRRFRTIVKAAGLPEKLRLYDLRHSAATLMGRAGVPLKTIGDQLGHASIQQTADTYLHTLPDAQRDASAKLANALFGPDAPK